MAITYPLSIPSVVSQRNIVIRANSTVGVSSSPFTADQQIYVHQGEYFEADVQLAPMKNADAEEWIGFLLALNGREGTFLMGDPGFALRGVGTGTPLVNGGSQTGKTLNTKGWTSSVTGILKAGDWIQLGSGSSTHLHKMVQAADSDASGNATLEIWPRLRTSPANNDALVISSAKGLWRLKSNTREWSVEAARIYGISFQAQEAL